MAFLKFSMGGFKSHEYLNYYYEFDAFDWTVPVADLDPRLHHGTRAGNDEITLRDTRLADNRITGTLEAAGGGRR